MGRKKWYTITSLTEEVMAVAVDNDVILRKMFQEMEQARKHQYDQNKFVKHIEKISLLCDLFLSNKEDRTAERQMTPEEMKMMLGEKQDGQLKKAEKSFLDDDGNGESIFDF